MGLRRGVKLVLAIAVTLCLSATRLEAQLLFGFYDHSCSSAEGIVKAVVQKAVNNNPGIAAGLLRLHFHDCFVRGCDASVLLSSTPNSTAERDSAPNLTLRGFEVIDQAKALIEIACPRTVSCADIVAMAARDSVAQSGGPNYNVACGRRDGNVSLASEALANLPPPTANFAQLVQMFASKGLDQYQMMALSGAHTIGRSHCTSFDNRLYGFNATNGTDPTMKATYAATLKQACPKGNDASAVVLMDPDTPNKFDVNYYRRLLQNQGLLTSDQTLTSTAGSLGRVTTYANYAVGFLNDFADAMVSMGRIQVLAGTAGEIRTNCSRIN